MCPRAILKWLLPRPTVADEDDVGVVLDEAQAKQILDLGPVDLLRPAPVELIQGLEHREAGQSHPPLDTAVFAPVGLAFDEPRQIMDVGPLLGAGLLCQGFEVLEQIGQFEARQVRAQRIAGAFRMVV